MKDPRLAQLAQQLITYSVELQPDEKIYLEIKGIEALDLGRELIRVSTEKGGVPFWYFNDETISRGFIKNAKESQFESWGRFHRVIMKQVDAYIAVRGSANPFDLADVDTDRMKWFNKAYWEEVHSLRVAEKKWCVLRYPNPSIAILSEKATETFEDYYFKVCTLDYRKMSKAMDPLVLLLENTDRVDIKGPGTDLSFSIKGLGAVKCDGHRNIPDGEVYSCPVRDSMNGTVTYNAASMRNGMLFRDVHFEVKDGRIQTASCSGDNTKLNEILDTDEGARYFGEFAFGLNPHITEPMLDTLFDEKINGSFHLTPGRAYERTDNGNKSAVHWDLVCIQTEEWGGGEIWLDGQLVRKDGLFVPPELHGLNPSALK